MTQNSTKRWKVILPVSIAAILLVGVAGFNLFTPYAQAADHSVPGDPWTGVPTDPPTDPPTKVNTICPQENVQHWDKIIFEPKLKGSENEISIPGVPGSELREKKQHDIKILDDPNTVVDLERAVAQKLNSLGYFVEKQLGGDSTTIQEVSPNNIKIKDVEYAIACVSNAVDPEPPSEI